MTTTNSQHRMSTRLAFLAAGVGMSAWAALVPLAQARMELTQSELGLMLLFLGIGSLTAMPITGLLAARFGCRPVILWSGSLVCVALPALSQAPTPVFLAITLFVFGAAIGTLDVAMNIQAVIVEKNHGSALMSGFHGLFSVGGIFGAGGMALLLSNDFSPLASCLTVSALVAVSLLIAAKNLLHAPNLVDQDGPRYALPRGAVILIGVLCFIVFLAEGAILDWSALLLTTSAGVSTSWGGIGYAVFALAMTAGRLTGDRIVQRWGGRHVLLWGALCAASGFFIAVVTTLDIVVLLGFLLIGAGASNIVPVLFTAAGSQHDMPASLAVSAVSTIGYAGILAGPTMIGFIAHLTSLNLAFAALGCAMLLVAGTHRRLEYHSKEQ
ncbi:MFS transporter [Pseudomonas syringae]|uniref:MFS transporter n=1 Tax=Pseudomonas syringae TaxID=317 RepID=UPI0019175176|nr:MFS transporter [Pseudomonas syringae]QQQ51877.1 MFS transporter [Pseudomonas syringae]